MSTSIRCDQPVIERITTLMQASDEDALVAIDEAVNGWPSDARLYFLRGAIQGHLAQYAQARSDLSRAIALDPELYVARFMLGHLEIQANDPAAAIVTFLPLTNRCEEDSMRLFATGMIDLLEHRTSSAMNNLKAGLEASPKYPALEPYIHSALRQINENMGQPSAGTETEPTSDAGHFLLSDYLHRLN